MKKLISVFTLLFFTGIASLYSQESAITVILLRHAEKADAGKDPDLSEKGKQFASALAKLLEENKVDAVYTTPYKRTSQTVQSIASNNSLKLISYDPSKSIDLVQNIEKSSDKIVVVVGHSNTINVVHNILVKGTKIDMLGEDEYRKVFIIHYNKTDPAKVLQLS